MIITCNIIVERGMCCKYVSLYPSNWIIVICYDIQTYIIIYYYDYYTSNQRKIIAIVISILYHCSIFID